MVRLNRPRACGGARALLAGAVALAGASDAASAHAFGERYELAAPVWLFIVGGALTVTVTFVMVALFARGGAERYAEAKLDLGRSRLGRALCHPWTRTALKGIGVFIFAATLVVGFAGATDPNRNLVPTLVWIGWWIGFSYLVMLGGNLWPLVNPWRTLFDGYDAWRGAGRGGAARYHPYPARLGAWPALGLLLLFGWFELIFPFSATPPILAALIVCYSAVTWAGMARYGAEAWQGNVDPFERVFELFSRFAPLAPADGQGPQPTLVLRPYAAALLRGGHESVPSAVACFVIAMLAIVLFDGLLGSGHWTTIENAVHAILPRLGDAGWLTVHTVGLLALWCVLLGLFLLACAWMKAATGGEIAALDYMRAFALTLIPIAVGYHFAHTFSNLLVQGQHLVPQISDPFGRGWDLFGTRDFAVTVAVMSTKTAWYLAVGAIVIGHAVSVYLAHAVARRLLASRAQTFKCLLPMTILMVAYTIISLQILAEPLVRYSGPQETII